MKRYIDIELVVKEIDDTVMTSESEANRDDPLWRPFYRALKYLRSKSKELSDLAKEEGYYLKDINDALHSSEV